jgi:hypothetical protein
MSFLEDMAELNKDGSVQGPFETATLHGLRVHYRLRPSKKRKDTRTIFLWHGFLGSVFSWNRVWDLFADNFDGNILGMSPFLVSQEQYFYQF